MASARCYSPETLERRRKYTRQWKARNPDAVQRHNREGSARHRLRHPDRVRARTLLNTAIRDGKVARGTCEVCGARAEAHHADYARPYDVVWLCKLHHEASHHA